MQTNFDYLKNEEKFSAFSDVAISAEKIVLIDPEACVINCRRAMEFAVKWMYSVEKQLDMPYQDNLQSLMNAEDFRDIVGYDIWKRMDYIRICGNKVAHNNKKSGKAEAMLCLENLSIFLDFLACCYSASYEEHIFDRQLIEDRINKAKQSKKEAADTKESLLKKINELEKKDLDLQSLIKENMALKEELSARREEQQDSYVPKPLDLSEYKTRKLYIDSMLEDAGWIEGKDWINEYEIPGMPNKSEVGFADYVLMGDDGRILAVIEAKRTCVDVSKGRQQAKLYADLIEQRQKRRPVVFLTNGFETRIIDNQYPERKISVVYSKRDLEKLFNLQTIGKKYSRGMHDLISKVSSLSNVANIPEIMVQADLINQILHTDYLDNAGINEFEYIRENLRELMKYIPKGAKVTYDTNFDDEILSMDWKESELENDDLKNYKAKAEYFVRQHQDNAVIAKLKSNKPLTSSDIKILEEILWSEVGTKQDYEAEYGEKPLGEFVREIVGLDMTAAKEAFAEYLDETNLDSRQIYFVNQIVEFIVHNGMMKDLSVLQEAPFTDQGSIVEVFTDLSVWMGIRRVIEQVNANALAA